MFKKFEQNVGICEEEKITYFDYSLSFTNSRFIFNRCRIIRRLLKGTVYVISSDSPFKRVECSIHNGTHIKFRFFSLNMTIFLICFCHFFNWGKLLIKKSISARKKTLMSYSLWIRPSLQGTVVDWTCHSFNEGLLLFVFCTFMNNLKM